MNFVAKLAPVPGVVPLAVWAGWVTIRAQRRPADAGPLPYPALCLDLRPHPPFPTAYLAALDGDVRARFRRVVN